MDSIETNYNQRRKNLVDKIREHNHTALQSDADRSDDKITDKKDSSNCMESMEDTENVGDGRCWVDSSLFHLKCCFIGRERMNNKQQYILCKECRKMFSNGKGRKKEQS